MIRRRVYRPKRAEPPFRLDDPEAFPAYVFSPSASTEAAWLRGGPVFEAMAEMGFRVQVLEQQDAVEVTIHRPWTFLFMHVPSADWAPVMESLADRPCSVIMDCHFPIMNMGDATGSDESLIATIDTMDTLLANLALAEVVTVPHPDWAADLAEVNQNVFLLPDLEETGHGVQLFMSRIAAAANMSGQVKQARWRARGEMGL